MMIIMSRTVRYFKLMYIVAGILMSNEEICETVDQIKITPNVEVKEFLQPRKVYRGVERVSGSWLRKFYRFGVGKLKNRLTPLLGSFSIWTIPNYLIDCSSSYISRKLVLGSDCDMIYK